MRKKNFSIVLVIFLFIASLFAVSYVLAAASGFESGGPSSNTTNPVISAENDAIAVRIVPNPSHYSIYRWYESQGFGGSPQALTVDGYEAIRDGRTVYVNAANILPESRTIFTNIYLISYNQNPNVKTVDILGQIVSHWKFNSNLVPGAESLNICSISALLCSADSDCQTGQTCSENGQCLLTEEVNCMVDEDCPANFFCGSTKAKVVRDLKRVGKLEELKESLAKYKEVNGRYPLLSAGTYLANHTVSVWPSWSTSFLSGLAVVENFIDPINRLGKCTGFDQQTCWDEISKTFVYNPTSGYLKLPNDSYAFVYSTDSNGSNYNLCAVMESRDLTDPLLGYQFSPNDPVAHQCVVATGVTSGGQLENTAPRIISKSLAGEAGQEYNGFIKAIDDQDNPITWSMLPVSGSWPDWVNSTSSNAPILLDTNDPNQKKIYAEKAGAPNTYYVKLILSDSEGASLTTTTPIVINNQSPFIEAENASHVLDPTIPLDYSFFYSDNDVHGGTMGGASTKSTGGSATNKAAQGNSGTSGGNSQSTTTGGYSVTKLVGPYDIFNASGITETVSSAGINRYEVNFHGLIPLSHKLYQDTDFIYEVKVTDKYNNSSTKKFTLRVLVNDPLLTFSCSSAVRVNGQYSCKLGPVKQGNYNLAYSSNPLPTGLFLQALGEGENTSSPSGGATGDSSGGTGNDSGKPTDSTGPADKPTSGNIFLKIARYFNSLLNGALAQEQTSFIKWMYLLGTPTSISDGYQIDIKATNDYGASSTKSFVLKINNFCGDATKQSPNLEGRGGLYNDGYEDCDNQDGTTQSIANSSIDLQYGCATEGSTPYPILNNSYCVFLSPLDGGGFCGDSYCQSLIGENSSNCIVDCDPNCTPNCQGKQCGSDGCSGTCGACNEGQTCDNGVCKSNCQPNCQGKQCGSDGCGGSCGTCPTQKHCNAAGHCVANAYCGDGACNNNENCVTCSGDCPCLHGQACNPGTAACAVTCGDGVCNYGENCATCVNDCACPYWQGCYNGVCLSCTPECM